MRKQARQVPMPLLSEAFQPQVAGEIVVAKATMDCWRTPADIDPTKPVLYQWWEALNRRLEPPPDTNTKN